MSQIPQLLDLQRLRSAREGDGDGSGAHDEHLFIIIHQGTCTCIYNDQVAILLTRAPNVYLCFTCVCVQCSPVYELWFKEIIHEIDSVTTLMGAEVHVIAMRFDDIFLS